MTHSKKEYCSHSYLTEGSDFRSFKLASTRDRVPPHDLDLDDSQSSHAQELLRNNVVVSFHDHPQILPEDPAEIEEYYHSGRLYTAYSALRDSGMTAVFLNFASMLTPKHQGGSRWNELIYAMGVQLADIAHQDYVVIAHSVNDILQAHENDQLAFVLATEASDAIESDLDKIDILYGFGMRQMGIAYSESNALGSGLKERYDGGLTSFGRLAVERMNKIGMAIDVSHSSDRTCLDVIEVSSKPVLITHAGARNVWRMPRMKPDEVLKACAESDGVVGLSAAPHTTISETHRQHSIESVMDHFAYCVDLIGIDHVAFGPDTFYGDHVGLHRSFTESIGVHQSQDPNPPAYDEVAYVSGLENPSENFTNITGWLVKHGYSDEDISKVLGGNIVRALREIW